MFYIAYMQQKVSLPYYLNKYLSIIWLQFHSTKRQYKGDTYVTALLSLAGKKVWMYAAKVLGEYFH